MAFASGSMEMVYIGVGVAAIFIITMGGAHHVIVAIVALVIIYVATQMNDSTILLYSLIGAAGLFLIFVLHGKEEGAGGGAEGYPMGMGLPMGY